jgi:protein gp37
MDEGAKPWDACQRKGLGLNMGDTTKISWTGPNGHTENFWVGCKAVSTGCGLGEGNGKCYAEAWAERMGRDFSKVTRTKTWGDPLRWQKKLSGTNQYEMVFTCSLSDFFIEKADPWRAEAWKVICETPNLIYQILRKRPGLVEKRLPADWGEGYPHCWLGVSVESKAYLWRMKTLRKIPAVVRFVSAEPLFENLMPEFEGYLEGFLQCIIGGQSGNGSRNFRSMDHQWAREMFAACKRHGVARFFKQSSAIQTEMGTKLDGELVRE